MQQRKRKPVPIGERFGKLIVLKEVETRVRYRKDRNTYEKIRMVKVECDCGKVFTTILSSLKNGNTKSCGCTVKEKSHNRKKLVYGIGINDYDGRVKIENKLIKSYLVWISMLRRCYDTQSLTSRKNYLDCTICDEWVYFSKFLAWFTKNYDPNVMQGWHLDKDILVKGNKIYSPQTCCFVPQEINVLFTKRQNCRGELPIGAIKNHGKFSASLNKKGNVIYLGNYNTPEEAFNAYKVAKEVYIKEVANKWKDVITNNVYEAMYNYKIEITD